MKRSETEYLTMEEAIAKGYGALTRPYGTDQRWMMDRVLEDMRGGGIRHGVVQTGMGPEVWRANIRREP